MKEPIDFTNCKRIIGKAYNGANGKKIAIEFHGIQYMVKFPPSGAQKPTELSYTNGCASEYIACHIFNLLGVPAQETLLGTFRVGEKEKVVCACQDFTVGGKRLYDFCSIKNTILDSDTNGNGTELDEIIETIEKQAFVEPSELLKRFWDIFVLDTLLGNFDRHNGNWGFLYDEETERGEIAPVYDCGSCLLPQADDRIMRSVLEQDEMLLARVYQFPTSAIKWGGRKINYYDFLMSTDRRDCYAALHRIVPRINLENINTLIEETPYISDLQKQFYKYYIKSRYELILIPALQKINLAK
ncbi:MAG: CtkA family protein [Clostridiales bacterium]|nr:CtkA family protein [Clostridiales bacterium]MEE1368151.1 HipA domain-containing protein [Evtepia sp.]